MREGVLEKLLAWNLCQDGNGIGRNETGGDYGRVLEKIQNTHLFLKPDFLLFFLYLIPSCFSWPQLPSYSVEHISSSDCPPCLLVMVSCSLPDHKKRDIYMSHRDNGFLNSGSEGMCVRHLTLTVFKNYTHTILRSFEQR